MGEVETDQLEVLWVGEASNAYDLSQLAKETQKTDRQSALTILDSRSVAVVVVSVASSDEASEIGEFLTTVSNLWPNITRLVFVGNSLPVDHAQQLIQSLVNSVGVHFLFREGKSMNHLVDIIERAVDGFNTRKEQNRIHQEVKLQNARLEEMTDGLELMVAERTRYLSLSKSQVEGKISGMRGLIQFIKNLSSLSEIEDLYLLLRQDIKSFHQVQNVYLGYLSSDQIPRIMYFQSREVRVRSAQKMWDQSLRIRVNQVEDSQYLANEFSRPFAKVIGIPILIKTNGAVESIEPRCESVIYFEHTFQSEDEEIFLNYIGERLQPLGLTFDRIQLDRQVKTASLMWEKTFDGVKDPIAILDRDHQLMRNNQSFGWESDSSICFKKFNNLDHPCVGCPVPSVFESSKAQVGNVKKGSRMFEVHSYPIQLVSGSRPSNVVNYYVDVTLKQELQGKMIQNEKMAAIGHLAGNIAHELNNPLTGIRSLCQVLISEVEAGSNRYDDLCEVEKAAGRCQGIITNLLDFSKETGAKHLESISLNEIVTKTLPFLKVAMRNHNCRVELSKQEPFVRAEPQLLQQVVFNIVNNACQSMRDPGTLTVETDIFEKEGKQFSRLKVSDTGVGISKENLKSIFDPFFTTKSVGQGTGLGLSMSKNIIESVDGAILVNSEVGEGTCFFVELPFRIGGST